MHINRLATASPRPPTTEWFSATTTRRFLALTSAKLAGYVLLLVPVIVVPIIVLGRRLRRLSRENQDWIANSSGKATEALGAVQTVQSFTHEAATKAEFGHVTEQSFLSAKARIANRDLQIGRGWSNAGNVRLAEGRGRFVSNPLVSAYRTTSIQ